MRYINNLPYEIKTVVLTTLLTVLSLNAKQEMSKQKQSSKEKAKSTLTTFNSMFGMDVAYCTYTLPVKPIEEPVTKPLVLDSTNTVIANQEEANTIKQHFLIKETKNIEKETTIANNAGVKIVSGKGLVKYIYADGSVEVRQGGTLPWRNKNPGALRGSDKSVGRANKFAVFASEEEGMAAMKALLCSDRYRNLSLKAAIFKYAPPHENNTTKYQSDLKKYTGLDITRKLCDLSEEELERVAQTIKRLEGWKPGKVTYMESLKNKQKEIIDTLMQNVR